MRKTGILTISILVISILVNINAGNIASAQETQTLVITEIGQLNTSGFAASIHVKDGVAIVADSDSGLCIIDVSDPENPTELSRFDEGIDHIHELYVDEDLAYIADYTEGFKVINISDSINPTQVGLCHDGGEVGTFDIYEDLAFIADFEDGLEIVNISDPTDPTEIYQYNTGISYIFNVEINNDLAYVSDFISATQKSLIVLNISDLSNIQELAEFPIDGEVFSIDFVGDIAYMMCSYGGVKVFNISNPLSLTEIYSHNDGGHSVDLEFYNDYAFIADREEGLEILDINDLSNVTEVGNYYDGGSASGIAIVDELIYVADGEDGLEILQIGNAQTTGVFDLALFAALSGSVALVGLVIVIVWRKVKGR
ncbi:MAG: LVIVD repeat-containing protein [Candidatus Thorarchaeota archaeon]